MLGEELLLGSAKSDRSFPDALCQVMILFGQSVYSDPSSLFRAINIVRSTSHQT
jgi:hypothetical protein